MKINYDIINIFLIIFIFYYLLLVISKKYKTIEGIGGNQIMCSGNEDPSLDYNRCSDWPFTFKSQAGSTKQCIDGTANCSEEIKLLSCCNQRAEMCQGNIDPRFSDWRCRGNNNIPKIDATELPKLCDENNTTDCWEQGLRGGLPIGLDGCQGGERPCNLSDLPLDEQRQNICCTNYDLYSVAETIWGRPHLISAANLNFSDYKEIKDVDPIEAEKILNDALDYLHQARLLSDDDRSIVETINDWGREIQMDLGINKCQGNINPEDDYPCNDLGKEYITNSFLKNGFTSEECCKISGMCTNNTNEIENVECPENTSVIQDKKGNTIEECCEANIKCSGNENINLNYRCPDPMILKFDSNEIYGNTKEDCCRYPEEKSYIEIDPISENETISATIIFNGDILLSVGEKLSDKYFDFIIKFRKDLVDIINEDERINILEEQIIVNDIYSGSIIVDFDIIPHEFTGISISKEYLLYKFNEDKYFPTLELLTSGGISNVKITSWYNINYWPNWIWYVITSIITVLITLVLFL